MLVLSLMRLLKIGKDLHVRSAKVGVKGIVFIRALAPVVMHSKYISAFSFAIGSAGRRG